MEFRSLNKKAISDFGFEIAFLFLIASIVIDSYG